MPKTRYIWDPETDAYLMETDGDGNTTAVYTQEPKPYGGLISQRRDGQDSYYQQDALGSTRQLTDAGEAVTDEYTYSAYGETVASSGSTVNPFRWIGGVGYYHDAETEDYYVRARNYAPTTGRWISIDPLLFVDGPNLFVAHFVPQHTDPSGLLDFWYKFIAKYRCTTTKIPRSVDISMVCYHPSPESECREALLNAFVSACDICGNLFTTQKDLAACMMVAMTGAAITLAAAQDGDDLPCCYCFPVPGWNVFLPL